MKMQRKRWIIDRAEDRGILCGSFGYRHFELPDKSLKCDIRTFSSEEDAVSAVRQAYLDGVVDTLRIVTVIESIEYIDFPKVITLV